ncbi:hypothetical protein [Streptomyces sp. NPDC058612]|uniref:hypothetical protein n=1 Tax=Streptomyces sp. NPDC058612 TaxID=3346555 RepID=UPI0036504976
MLQRLGGVVAWASLGSVWRVFLGTKVRALNNGGTVRPEGLAVPDELPHPAGRFEDTPAPEVSHGGAQESIRLVIAWYSEQIMKQRRADEPDQMLLAELLEARRASLADQQALGEAKPEEAVEIMAAYAARYRSLTAD